MGGDAVMRTWSLESAFIKAYTSLALGIQDILDAATKVERITRPPRRSRMVDDLDCDCGNCVSCWSNYGKALREQGERWGQDVDGADELAEREAEEEVREPSYLTTQDWTDVRGGHLGPYHDPGFDGEATESTYDEPTISTAGLDELLDEIRARSPDDDTPNPTEPGLTDDELVAVRQIIEERFGEEQNPFIVRLAERVTAIEQLAQLKRMSEKLRTESSAPASAVSGEAVSGHSPAPPASPRPAWSDLADAMVEHRPAAKVDDVELTYSQRGFRGYGEPLRTTYGHQVSIYESSAASAPHIWLRIEHDGDNSFCPVETAAHLSLEQAVAIQHRLAVAIKDAQEQ